MAKRNHALDAVLTVGMVLRASSSYHGVWDEGIASCLGVIDMVLDGVEGKIDEAKLVHIRNSMTPDVINFMAENGSLKDGSHPLENNVAFLTRWVATGKLVGGQDKLLNTLMFVYVKPFAHQFVQKVLLPIESVFELKERGDNANEQ